jgi:leader peptidase (prepilin peptidase)/N-methyltransferase
LFIFGSCIGSFLNVCIDRWPKDQSIVSPRSHCPHCQKQIPWYLNIPIITWALLHGKAACCGNPIPFRYILSELTIGLIAVITFTFANQIAIPYFILICLLWITFFTDLETLLIPDQVTLSGLPLGIILSAFYPQLQLTSNAFYAIKESLIGMCIGSGSLFLIASIAEFFMKEEALGVGDIKLLGCIVSLLGAFGCLYTIFFGSLFGTFFIVTYYIFTKIFRFKTDATLPRRIAFAPFLVLGTATYMIILCLHPDSLRFFVYTYEF